MPFGIIEGLMTAASVLGAGRELVEAGRGVVQAARGIPVSTAVSPTAGGGEFARLGIARDGFQQAQLRAPIPRGRIPVVPPRGRRGIPPFAIPVPGDGNGPVVCRPVSRIQQLLQVARANSGQAVTSRRIREFVRTCGLEIAADFYGLLPIEIGEIVISSKRRRSRGISAADLRRCRSTIRKMKSFQKQLGVVRRR